MHELALNICDCAFVIRSGDEGIAALVETGFGAMQTASTADPGRAPSYQVSREPGGARFRVADDAGASAVLEDAGDLLFYLDKELTLAAQRRRPDLFFLHAGAVARAGKSAVLPAQPGTGKSTVVLALLEAGFEYLSDELAPIDAGRAHAHPYPHALGLKSLPPEPYRLPPGALRSTGLIHVPPESLGAAVIQEPSPVAAFFFLERGATVNGPPAAARRLSPAAASAHLLSNALNSRAHPESGIQVAASLGRAVPSYRLEISDLVAACGEIEAILGRGAPAR